MTRCDHKLVKRILVRCAGSEAKGFLLWLPVDQEHPVDHHDE